MKLDEHTKSEVIPLKLKFEWGEVTPFGLSFTTREMEFDQFEKDFKSLCEVHTGLEWALGDAYKYARSRWREKSKDLAIEHKISLKTLQNYAWVSGKFEPISRRFDLSFSHYSAVAGLVDASVSATAHAFEILSDAAKGRWSVDEVQEAVDLFKEHNPEAVDPNGDPVFPPSSVIAPWRNAIAKLRSRLDQLPSVPEKGKVRASLNELETAVNELETAIQRDVGTQERLIA